jgi:hypothetical protein
MESAPNNGAPTASKNFNRILFAAATLKEPPPILKYHFRQSKSGHDHCDREYSYQRQLYKSRPFTRFLQNPRLHRDSLDLNEVGSEKLRRGLRIPDSRGRAVLMILGDNPRSTHLDLIEWKNPKHAGMCGERSDDGEYGTDYGSEPRNRTRSRSHARVRGLARDSRSARSEVGTPGNTRGGCRHGRLRIG